MNHTKMQNSVIFVSKNLKVSIRKIRNIVKTEINVMAAHSWRGTAHSICNLKNRVPKQIIIAFQMDLTIAMILS